MVKENTFWSDSMTVCLSDAGALESSIAGPHQIISEFVPRLKALAYKVVRVEQSIKGSTNFNAQHEAFLDCGADQHVIENLEQFLTEKEITFTKHMIVNDADHIDLSYDLNNISVWKRDT